MTNAEPAVSILLPTEGEDIVYGVAYDVPHIVDGKVVGHRTVVRDLAGLTFAQAAVDHRVPWKVDGVRATGHRVVTRPVLSGAGR